MDYRMIVKDSYKRLPEMRQAVQNLRRRADRAKRDAAVIRANDTDAIRVQGGRKSSDRILDNLAMVDLCERQAEIIAAEVDELNNALSALPPELQQVVEIVVINGRPADEACDAVHIERRSVYNYIDRALEQLARSLWGAVLS